MAFKLLLNVLYTIGILISLYTIYWGVTHGRWEFIVGGAFVGIIFFLLKITLMKEVRAMQKPASKK
ncbi:DUF6358 family protein [Mucilaginibacter aquatilis]|uniref:Uncharacterized protein n=1 Tax=Mucilaginibacter aquatilis TaxID=1517760 RepID=A0A6I4I7B8_9SPHI|nr:DUF6358 family protein [Mucilaginibacter aquatilis]MVN90982.1 hypothetical protein [Mucilaginibacter aquatilis]